MKTTLLSLLLLASVSIEAQNLPQTFKLADAPRYSEKTGYGYDRVDTPKKGSNAPFYFSVRVPDGNYRVTVRLGSKNQAGNTTVRAESRRLFVENLPTKKGEFVEETFIVNKRSPRISAKESVKVKDRRQIDNRNQRRGTCMRKHPCRSCRPFHSHNLLMRKQHGSGSGK